MAKLQKGKAEGQDKKTQQRNASGVIRQRIDRRSRSQYRFWLDAMKDDELLMMEELDELKRHRRFAKTLRDALRLFLALRKGDLRPLEALFPAAVAAIYERGRADALAEAHMNTSDQFNLLMARIDELSRAGHVPTPPITVPLSSSVRPLVLLDDDLEDTVIAVSDDEIFANFLKG